MKIQNTNNVYSANSSGIKINKNQSAEKYNQFEIPADCYTKSTDEKVTYSNDENFNLDSLLEGREVNEATKNIVNTRLSKYSVSKKGMVHFDKNILETMYTLKPKTVSAIGNDRILYVICSDRKEAGSLYNSSILNTKDRILKLISLEDNFTSDELEDITFSVYDNSNRIGSFLEWLLSSDNAEDDEQLIAKAKGYTHKNIKPKEKTLRSLLQRLFNIK